MRLLVFFRQHVLHGEFAVAALKQLLLRCLPLLEFVFSTANSPWPH